MRKARNLTINALIALAITGISLAGCTISEPVEEVKIIEPVQGNGDNPPDPPPCYPNCQ